MKHRVLIEQDETGWFVAECPSLPGCVSQGKTRANALENIQEAIAGYIESLEAHGDPVPPAISTGWHGVLATPCFICSK